MSQSDRNAQTSERRQSMLRSAFSGVVREALIADDVIEILVNPDGSIWIERTGSDVIRETESMDAEARERVIRLVASSIGQRCDRDTPIISAELPVTGERFEGLLPPVSEAPCFAIRKAARAPFTLNDFEEQGTIAPALAAELRLQLADRRNILIAGGASSGKTTFANALLADPILKNERIAVLEDTRELRPSAANVVSLRTHRDQVSLSDLVRSTMRLRPDRIVVGEVRGPEALDLLKAWNTGHPGGITTVHANSARSALNRLEQLTLEATTQPPWTLIAEAIDVVIYMSRKGGVRRVEEALFVVKHEDGDYVTTPLIQPHLFNIIQGGSYGSQ